MKLINKIKLFLNVKKFIPFLLDFFTSSEVRTSKKLFSILMFIVYLIFPLDIIPDFFAFFGFIDDATILLFILSKIVNIAPDHLKEKHGI
ncbi:MAG: putative rane protein [Bacillales bacterium]|jgi:uncharacterized membrane protein YkvA (DUF1232 family)|nr:putative rane protein [Bacillales bacterium]